MGGAADAAATTFDTGKSFFVRNISYILPAGAAAVLGYFGCCGKDEPAPPAQPTIVRAAASVVDVVAGPTADGKPRSNTHLMVVILLLVCALCFLYYQCVYEDAPAHDIENPRRPSVA